MTITVQSPLFRSRTATTSSDKGDMMDSVNDLEWRSTHILTLFCTVALICLLYNDAL